MSIFDALKFDHREVRDHLSKLVNLVETDEAIRGNILHHLSDALFPHVQAEETIFYSALRDTSAGHFIASECFEEHRAAVKLVRVLQQAKKIDAEWIANARQLKLKCEAHMDDEETRVMVAARKIFSREEAEIMGDEFELLKAEIRKARHFTEPSDMS